MYPWVDYLHTHMGGKCPHECKYCYVQTMHRSAIKAKYSGELRLYENEFKANYDKKGVYFIEHMNDLFARGVPTEMVKRILAHCNSWPDNKYIFQTKNPEVILDPKHGNNINNA